MPEQLFLAIGALLIMSWKATVFICALMEVLGQLTRDGIQRTRNLPAFRFRSSKLAKRSVSHLPAFLKDGGNRQIRIA